MLADDGRAALLRVLTAHMRGGDPSSLITQLRRTDLLVVRAALPELLTAVLIAGDGIDDEVIDVVVSSAERYPSLDEHSARAAADEQAVARLLDALGAHGLIEASDDLEEVDPTAHWEECGRMLADRAALAVAGADLPSRSSRPNVLRAAVLETACLRPRAAMRILRWMPFVEEAPAGDGVESELFDYIGRVWARDAEVGFGRVVLASIGP